MSEVRFLETHGDIFVGGKNHGKKHRPKAGLKIEWDEEKKAAFLTWNNERGRIFDSNINLLVEGAPVELPKNEHQTHDVTKIKSAQVSSPMGHVFEGQGAGKTGKSK